MASSNAAHANQPSVWASAAVIPQRLSLLFGVPREIRDAIYYEIWQSMGTKQHIFWHGESSVRPTSRYCLRPCTTTYEVEDSLQSKLEKVWDERGRPQLLEGDDMATWIARLQSPWYNHWRCEEDLSAACEDGGCALKKDRSNMGEFRCPCLARCTRSQYSYLPLLLSCKRL